jgi:hypothetical protein
MASINSRNRRLAASFRSLGCPRFHRLFISLTRCLSFFASRFSFLVCIAHTSRRKEQANATERRTPALGGKINRCRPLIGSAHLRLLRLANNSASIAHNRDNSFISFPVNDSPSHRSTRSVTSTDMFTLCRLRSNRGFGPRRFDCCFFMVWFEKFAPL